MNALARWSAPDRAAETRLAERIFADLARETADTAGVCREAYGAGEQRALDHVRGLAVTHGLVARSDAAGNLVVTLPEDDGRQPADVIGSHLDSVPKGGNYDGAAGIVAGLIVLIRLAATGRRGARPVRLLGLRGEESAFYGRPNLGARALFGRLGPADLAAERRGGGTTLGGAMAAAGAAVDRIAAGVPLLESASVARYLELHIEQGPVLVEADEPIALVSGIRGNVRHRQVLCRGEAGHSGAVPRHLRRDAVVAFADLALCLDAGWEEAVAGGADLVVTTGMVGTDPDDHAISRVPGSLAFSFEARSLHRADMEAFHARLMREAACVERRRGVRFDFDPRLDTDPARLDPMVGSALARAAARCGRRPRTMPSGAGHDAAVFANEGIPSGMLFVRNRNGSHNPREAMDLDDLAIGIDVLAEAVSEG